MSTAAPFPKRYRPKYSRSKDGCLTCRTRRKRCGQEKPTCKACKSNFLSCCWPDQISSKAAPLHLDATIHISPPSPNAETVRTQDATESALELEADADADADAEDNLFQATSDSSVSTAIAIPLPRIVRYVLRGQGWPTGLSVTSGYLFQHYVEKTQSILSTRPLESNAFKALLPVAARDDMLMHCILATSGAHLNAHALTSTESRLVTSKHYIIALGGLRRAIEPTGDQRSQRKWLRLGAMLVMIAHVEGISGDLTGTIFSHLRALREIAMKLHQGNDQDLTQAEQDVKGLVLETYAYLAIVSNITPYGVMKERQLPLDPFIAKLDHLRKYRTFGSFFSGSQALFELILPTAFLAGTIMQEFQSQSIVTGESEIQYRTLVHHIYSLQLPEKADVVGTELKDGQTSVCELYKQALLIWLRCALFNLPVQPGDDPHPAIQSHIDAARAYFIPAIESQYCGILLWPTMILGSCVVRMEDIDDFRQLMQLAFSRLQLDQITAAIHVLEIVWTAPSRLCGPAGLLQVMEDHGINLCMA